MKAKLDSQIDELYKLPLDEFTKARNVLAKTLSGEAKKEVASLVKPSVAMWVVNQLYWQDAPTYKALVDASEKLRAAHRAALNGRKVDTSKADELHRTTLEKAFAKAAAIAQKTEVGLTDTVRDAVRRTLAALPTDEAPGRLTREPAAVGFSLLTGIKPRPIDTAREEGHAREKEIQKENKKEDEKRRKAAEAKARKEEEKARKEREKREREIEKAERALREAERRLAKLRG
jgi:septin family protein